MNKTNKPDIKITLSGDLFNTLFTAFEFFESFEERLGDNYHVHYSKMLKAKLCKIFSAVKVAYLAQ